MSKTLQVELPDPLYHALQRVAAATGATPSEVIATHLARHLPLGEEPGESERRPGQPQQVHPDILAILEQLAPELGLTVEEALLQWKAKYASPPRLQVSTEKPHPARARLLKHAGAIASGDPDAGANDRIDADLAREYQSTHEEQT